VVYEEGVAEKVGVVGGNWKGQKGGRENDRRKKGCLIKKHSPTASHLEKRKHWEEGDGHEKKVICEDLKRGS